MRDSDGSVVAVIARTFGEDQARRCARLWTWQYVDNPFIPRGGLVTVGLEHEGASVGCVGTIACRVKVDNRTVGGSVEDRENWYFTFADADFEPGRL